MRRMKTMDKLKMHSLNKVDDNIEKIKALFPNCVTEHKDENGETVLGVDFDMLKQELSSALIDGNEERYQFTWPDKKQAILTANAPISKTLRPCREESVDFDNTENLYIEGDNLDVLKLLQETYLGKIKMIYIDPPYNTGNDFVYNDDFAESADEYLANSGQFDSEGNRLVQNTESNGRFHTDWLNMIYPRLKLAKDLLSDDGVIFISIDDNEQENLKKCCDEIFGENNFISLMVWKSKSGGANDVKNIACDSEYILVYAKMYDFAIFNLDNEATVTTSYNLVDENGKRYSLDRLDKQSLGYQKSLDFPIIGPDGREYVVEHKNPNNKVARWRWGQDTVKERYNELVFKYPYVYTKNYEKEGIIPRNLMIEDRFGRTRTGKTEVAALFDKIAYFDFPKPTKLLKFLLKIASGTEDIVLDFFSGSATTAHAVMQLNAEDGGNRKFIMVQLPEETDEKSEAYKAGYKNICEIGKERIRRAGKKVKEDIKYPQKEKDGYPLSSCGEQYTINSLGEKKVTANDANYLKEDGEHITVMSSPQNPADKYKYNPELLDTGFRVLKLDTSNMKDVYYNPSEYEPSLFTTLADNIKEDRTPEDLLFQVMLDLGISLSSKIEETTVAGKKVFNVADGFLYACFDNNIIEDVITEIAKKTPYYFVMRDSSIASDSVATNFEQIFATYSPETEWKVL